MTDGRSRPGSGVQVRRQPHAPAALENRAVHGYRWWSADDLGRTTETVYPLQLAELLPALLADGWDGRLRLID